MLLILFVPDADVVFRNRVGAELVDNAHRFISRLVADRFLGYLQSQKAAMTGEVGAHTNRPELVAAHGYDTKFAMHALRLGLQGVELLTTGRITLPVPEPDLSYLEFGGTATNSPDRSTVTLVQNERVYLTITSTADCATDLGFLLHKHPARAQSFEVSAGKAYVFYPEATEHRCTAALLLEVDPIALVRGRRFGGDTFSLGQYVNDRPYAASSMLAVALGKVFRTAMAGRCEAKPELPALALPLEIHVPALPSVGGRDLVRRFFEPLGWAVEVTSIPLDLTIPAWGDSEYVDLRLCGAMPLSQALAHLYVLLPVLDNAKHYWVSNDEVDKLVRAGSGWLHEHPERDLIVRRYLKHQKDLVLSAVGRLAEIDDALPESLDNAVADSENHGSDADAGKDTLSEQRPMPLVEHRRMAVTEELKREGAARVVDLGCGEGTLLRALLKDSSFREILGVDVSHKALELAERRLQLDRLPDTQRARLTLLQSSLTYRDERFAGFDAVVLMEVIEHLDLPRLPSLERTVFAQARPKTVIVTTPNAEHNVRYEFLAAGTMRHRDHRFEWTRAEFAGWANRIADHHGYTVRFRLIGEDDPEVGPPTQMAVFTRTDSHAKKAS